MISIAFGWKKSLFLTHLRTRQYPKAIDKLVIQEYSKALTSIRSVGLEITYIKPKHLCLMEDPIYNQPLMDTGVHWTSVLMWLGLRSWKWISLIGLMVMHKRDAGTTKRFHFDMALWNFHCHSIFIRHERFIFFVEYKSHGLTARTIQTGRKHNIIYFEVWPGTMYYLNKLCDNTGWKIHGQCKWYIDKNMHMICMNLTEWKTYPVRVHRKLCTHVPNPEHYLKIHHVKI